RKDKERRPDFEARAWLIGQLVSARAALRLLEARAVAAAQAEKQLKEDPRAEVKLAWPEFAEYDCFACHHGLQPPPRWRQLRGFPGRRAGALPWGTWSTPFL